MPTNISFDHSNLYISIALTPSAQFKVGQPTSITISLRNSGTGARTVNVHLWWIGPAVSSTTGPMMDLVNGNKLVPPYGSGHPIVLTPLPTTGGTVTVSWIPSAADFPTTLGTSVPGCLFAQAEVLPSPPTDPVGDNSALTCWSPAHALCAQRTIHVAT